MKSTVKIVIIFGIVTSFLPVYPMAKKTEADHYVLLGDIRKFVGEEKKEPLSFLNKESSSGYLYHIDENDSSLVSLHNDKGLDVTLTAVAFLESANNGDKKKVTDF